MGEDSYRQDSVYKTNVKQIQPTSLLAVLLFPNPGAFLLFVTTLLDLFVCLPVSFLTGCSRTLMAWWVSSGEEGSERDTPSMMRMCCMPSVMESGGTA